MKKNCTHNPSTSQVSKSYHHNPVTFPYPPDPGEHVLETSSAPTTLIERDKLDLSSLIPPKGEMESSFSWTCPFKSSTSSTLCFGKPTLGKLNQETDFYMTKHMSKPSSGANRVSVSNSSLVTKNGEHFYGKNFIHDFLKSWKHIKEVDWGDKLKLNYTRYGYMLMEIDWGGKFNYTSCGYPMAIWQCHETHPTGHKTSEVDWGGHDPNHNNVNESLLSEVDWGAHNPDTDDPEQLTGESIQSFLTFVVQLQWLVALGRLYLHKSLPCPSLWMHHLDLKTNIYGYISIFQRNHLIQVSITYTHTHTHTHTHTKHTQKLYIYLHIIMHVSTRTCYIHHKRGVTEF